MASSISTTRPLSCWKSAFRTARRQKSQLRTLSMATSTPRTPPPPLFLNAPPKPVKKKIPIFMSPPSIKKACPEPLKTFTESELARLDPASSRTRLFSKKNFDQANAGDVLLVRFQSGEPFAGVCINIRRRGLDTSILLRNQVLRTGTEMWVKVYSPIVVGIEIVQRAEKRARRAKLTYMRQPKHDRGDLSGIVSQYIKTRRTLGAKGRNKANMKEVGASNGK